MKRVKEKEEEKKKKKKLEKTQIDLLKTLFLFRFVTIEGLMAYYDLKTPQHIRRRLKLLEDLGLVGKHYDGSYRLQGRPAEYYVTKNTIPLLRTEFSDMNNADFRLVYGHVTAAERFMRRSVALMSIYTMLRNYPMSLLVGIQLRVRSYDYLPEPHPDMLAHLDVGKETEHIIFIDYFDDAISIGIHGRKIGSYMQYQEDGGWSGQAQPFPTILLVCETDAMKRRAEKRVRFYDRQHYVIINFICVTITQLEHLEDNEINFLSLLDRDR